MADIERKARCIQLERACGRTGILIHLAGKIIVVNQLRKCVYPTLLETRQNYASRNGKEMGKVTLQSIICTWLSVAGVGLEAFCFYLVKGMIQIALEKITFKEFPNGSYLHH